jgi:hypothetical protein
MLMKLGNLWSFVWRFKQYKHVEPKNGKFNVYQQRIHPSPSPFLFHVMKMLLCNDCNLECNGKLIKVLKKVDMFIKCDPRVACFALFPLGAIFFLVVLF